VEKSLDAISKAYLSVALNSDQLGSVYDYVQTLGLLTSTYPTVWTDNYTSKTAVDRRLRQFLKKGSQLGPRDFWGQLVEVFKNLPTQAVPSNGADAAELLNSFHSGIIKKDEPKYNLESAWTAYFEVVKIICKRLSEEDRGKVLQELVIPIIAQYLRPTSENSQWAVPPTASLITQLLKIEEIGTTVESRWSGYTEDFVDDIRTSAPQQSKEYEKSQSGLIKQGSRFALFQQNASEAVPALRPVFVRSCASVILKALDVLKNRNGRPYGAAGVVADLLHKNKQLFLKIRETYCAIRSAGEYPSGSRLIFLTLENVLVPSTRYTAPESGFVMASADFGGVSRNGANAESQSSSFGKMFDASSQLAPGLTSCLARSTRVSTETDVWEALWRPW
jgi:E3 ubiquitin-protein ligase listerin